MTFYGAPHESLQKLKTNECSLQTSLQAAKACGRKNMLQKILIEVNPATSVDRESTGFRKILDDVSMRRCDRIFSELSESRTKKDGGKDCHVSTV